MKLTEEQVRIKELCPDGKWRKVPSRKKSKDGGFKKDFCRYCGSVHKLTKDHVVPKSRGGAKGVKNLQTLCSYCNGIKSNYTVDELLEILTAINERGIWYEWEIRYANYLVWLQFVTGERGFVSPILLEIDV